MIALLVLAVFYVSSCEAFMPTSFYSSSRLQVIKLTLISLFITHNSCFTLIL